MVTLEVVVEILSAAMLNARQARPHCGRIASGFIGGYPHWYTVGLVHGVLEERLRRLGIAALREVGIDHLPILIDRAVDVGPLPIEAHVGFIDSPLPPNWLPMHTGRFPEQREEALDPAVYGTAINREPTLGKPLDDAGIAEYVYSLRVGL